MASIQDIPPKKVVNLSQADSFKEINQKLSDILKGMSETNAMLGLDLPNYDIFRKRIQDRDIVIETLRSELATNELSKIHELALYKALELISAGQQVALHLSQVALNSATDDATHDLLTALPNRRLFNDRLTQTMVSNHRHKTNSALLFIDIDKFKMINDAHGHDAGDALLLAVARAIKSCVRDVDTVARLGGDEFSVILVDLSSDDVEATVIAKIIAEKIITALSKNFVLRSKNEVGGLDELLYQSYSSIGVAMFSDAEPNLKVLIDSADQAMYLSKKEGGNRVKFCLDPIRHG